MSKSQILPLIRSLIANDQLMEAIELLLTSLKSSNLINEVILLSARYQSIARESNQGRIDFEDAQRQLNQLRGNILSLAEQLPEDELKTQSPNDSSSKDLTEEFYQSLARVTVVWLLAQKPHLEKGLSITEVVKLSRLNQRKRIVQTLQELEQCGRIEKYKSNNLIYWKLSNSGRELAEDFFESVLFDFLRGE